MSTRVDAKPSYPMFEAERLNGEGAFLTGPLLLEAHEDVTLELALPGGQTVRARARVTRVRRGEGAGMDVSFLDLSDDLKRKLTNGGND